MGLPHCTFWQTTHCIATNDDSLLPPHVQCPTNAWQSHMSCLAVKPKPVCCSGNGYVHFPAELTHATVKTLVLSRNLLNLTAHQQSVAPVVNPVLRVEVSCVVNLLMLLAFSNVTGILMSHCFLVLRCVTVIPGLSLSAAPLFGAV